MPSADPSSLFKALLLLLVLSGLDQTLLGTMLPSISAALGHAELAPWVFSSYLTTSTIAVPVYGKLADRYGPRPMLLTAAALFALGSAACAAAPGMAWLVAARALQGVGGGGLMTLAVLTAAVVYPPAERGRRMGQIGAAYSLATLVGPLTGGALLTVLPWQAAFLVNLPCAVLAWALIRRHRFGRAAAQPMRFDALGAVLLSLALAALLWATRHPLTSREGASAVAVAAVAALAWLATARRAADPVVPLGLFGDRAFRAAAGLAALSGVLLFGSVVFMPLYLQNGLHLDALHSAFCTVPLMLGITVAVQMVGRALRAGRSPVVLAALGSGSMALGAAAVATLLQVAPTQTIALGVALLPIGLGLGVSFPLTTVVAQRRAPPAQLGAASALPVMLRSLGGAVAVALLGEGLRRHVGSAMATGGTAPVAALAAGTSILFIWLAGMAALSLLLAPRLQVGLPGHARAATMNQLATLTDARRNS